jgi:uncharacterized protein (DUF1330 family)
VTAALWRFLLNVKSLGVGSGPCAEALGGIKGTKRLTLYDLICGVNAQRSIALGGTRMAVYLIATFDVTDPKAFEGYRPVVVPLLEEYGAEILAADYDGKALEGGRRGAYVIIRFESEEIAMKWYNDPKYQPSLNLRLGSTANGSLALVKEGYTPPTIY